MDIVTLLVVGLVAGVIASLIVGGTGYGILGSIAVGIADALSVEVHGSVLVIRRWHEGASRILVANFGEHIAEAPLRGSQLVASSKFELPMLPMLPPWSAAMVSRELPG